MKIEVGSPEWLELRRRYITATDIPIILGLSPWKTPLQLFWQKINGTESPQNEAMKRGIELEPEARDAFIAIMGEEVRPEFRICEKHPWLAASFDGINERGLIVEIKCPGKKDHLLALDGCIPQKYIPQLQTQIIVEGKVGSSCYFSYLPTHKEPTALIWYHSSCELEREILVKGKEFWNCLQTKTPPPACERDGEIRDINDEWNFYIERK